MFLILFLFPATSLVIQTEFFYVYQLVRKFPNT